MILSFSRSVRHHWRTPLSQWYFSKKSLQSSNCRLQWFINVVHGITGAFRPSSGQRVNIKNRDSCLTHSVCSISMEQLIPLNRRQSRQARKRWDKFETLIVCLRNRHCRNPHSQDFFSCYDKVFDVKCQLAFYQKSTANHPSFYMTNRSLTQSSWMRIPSLETGHCIQPGVSGGRSLEDFGHGVAVKIYLISPRRVL